MAKKGIIPPSEERESIALHTAESYSSYLCK